MRAIGLRLGSVVHSAAASTIISAAEMKNTACHDSAAVTKLDTGRASMMPSINPVETLPTTRPRMASGARCAA